MKYSFQLVLLVVLVLASGCQSVPDSGPTSPPIPVVQPPPMYPFVLRKAGIEGKVIVGFIVTKMGDVMDPWVMNSSDPRFERAAVAAVRKWKFKPGVINGRPVNCKMSVPLEFHLEDEPATKP